MKPATMAAAAGGRLQDAPSEAEIEMFRAAGTRFQILMVVISVAAFRTIDEVSVGTPYAVSLVPADKRGVVSEVDIDYVRQIDLEAYREARQPVFLNLNPFTGAWGLWGDAALLDPPRAGWPDGVGLVTDMYYLQRNFDPDDVLMVDLGVPLGRASRAGIVALRTVAVGQLVDGEPLAVPQTVTLSYHDAGRWLDAQERVDQVAAADEVVDWLRGFVDATYQPEPKRRKRPDSFKPLTDRFGQPVRISTEKHGTGPKP